MHRAIISATAALAVSLLCAAGAQADPTIAGAGTVVPGTQQFGNTLCPNPPTGPSCQDWQYWKLNGTSGDQVTINWQDSSRSRSSTRCGSSLKAPTPSR